MTILCVVVQFSALRGKEVCVCHLFRSKIFGGLITVLFQYV